MDEKGKSLEFGLKESLEIFSKSVDDCKKRLIDADVDNNIQDAFCTLSESTKVLFSELKDELIEYLQSE